jgi:hypothetical protein
MQNFSTFFLVNLAFMLQIIGIVYFRSLIEIKKNWPLYRCNPPYWFFSDNIAEDFTYCVQNSQMNIMGYLLQPVTYLISNLINISSEFNENINNIRFMISNIRGFFGGAIQKITGMFSNIVIEFQKMLIKKCNSQAKPVIVATQMMESMLNSMSPTRAEVNDVANAVLDGTDAVMLSGETSVGQYPIEVIKTMSNIIEEVEKSPELYNKEELPDLDSERFITDSICFNACRLSQRVHAKAIITMSFSGYTAYKISSQRPNTAIYVFTSNRTILSQLNLLWGVKAFYYDKHISTDHTIADIKYIMKSEGYLNIGDLVINIASIPLEDLGGSNMLKLSYVD